MLISTLPKTDAEKAVLARAKQLTDIKWTPIADVPMYLKKENVYKVFPKGVEVTGLPYSSVERTDMFIPENISFESFLSAVANPYSKLYTAGHGKENRANFGIVCNSFVRYAFGIPYRVPTKLWYTVPGMRKIADKEKYTAEELRLCDILHAFNDGRNHVALITDILRDENGQIVEIEVSEAVSPSCIRVRYTVEGYFERFKVFGLCRYDLMENVPPFDEKADDIFRSGIDKILPRIAVDNGNRSNYLLGQEVVLSVFIEGADTVELLKDGEVIREIQVEGRAFMPLTLDCGYYVARLKKDGAATEFAVVAATFTHTVKDGKLTVCATACDAESAVSHAEFRCAGDRVAAMAAFLILTDQERKAGTFTRGIPADAENFKVYFENRYGVWTHPMTKF